MTIIENLLPARRVTGGAHHFFGYYDKPPWDTTGRYLLAMQVDFMDRMPEPADKARIGMVDLEDGNCWIPLAETGAWGWQQGAMLQWLPGEPTRKIIYNQRDGDRFISVVQDVFSGETRVLPRAIYAINGSQALCLNFARSHRTRPGYGYVGVADSWADEAHPAKDGIFLMDIESGENRLIISLDQLRHFQPKPSMAQAQHWCNHIHIASDASNFICLHRWGDPAGAGRYFSDRLFSARLDGSGLCLVADDGYVSHLDHYSPDVVLAWARKKGVGDRYFLFRRCNEEVKILGDSVFTSDGHCSFSPDRRWLLTDTYPDARDIRALMLFHLESETRIDIGKYHAPPALNGPLRCDLHPRWNRDGRQVCIDSAHEGERQMYIIDVSEILAAFD